MNYDEINLTDHLQTAANAASPDGVGDVGLLNHKLGDWLGDLNYKLMKTGATTTTKQDIALAVHVWQTLNPEQRIYGE